MLALRGLTRSKTLSVFKITGLIIGISACLVVFLIASYELSFDRFQPDRHRIYRIYTETTGLNARFYSGAPTGWYSHVKSQFSGVESVCNFHTFSAGVKVPDAIGVNDFGKYDRIVITPPDYFDVFNFYEWVIGSPEQSLEPPLRVVLTESRARQYFGSMSPSDVIGKEIQYNDSLIVTVSGIVKDVSERTDFDFTDFVSFGTIESSWLKDRIQSDSWHSVNTSSQLFIKVAEKASALQLEQEIPNLARIFNRMYKNPWTYIPRLQPLADLHFNPTIGIFDHSRSVPERSALYTLIIVALLLLGIGVINYINLETAQATDRAKEVGVRKTLGSSRTELVLQFLIQSLIFAGGAVIIAPILAWILLGTSKISFPQVLK
jgi:putative ABC transport system permease protein